jgi:FixJ family two-component response regulator
MLTDVVMPGMSGQDLEDKLKASKPGIKVLYMSGYTDDAIVHHGILDRGKIFLQKPFTVEALGRKVKVTLED